MGVRPRYPSSQIAKAVTVAIPAQVLAQVWPRFLIKLLSPSDGGGAMQHNYARHSF